jgi:signal transduction histidine kinase
MLSTLVALISVLSLALGLVVLFQNTKSTINRYFALMALCNSLWSFSNFITAYSHNAIWVHAQYAFGALILGSGLEWLFHLIGKNKNLKRTIFIFSFSFLLFFTSFFGDLIIKRVDAVNFGSFEGEFGVLFYVYTLFIISTLLFVNFKLFSEAFKAVGLKRQQIIYVAFGALIFTFASTIPSFILPLLGIDNLSQFDVIGSFIYLSLITYSIVRHRLMNIRTLLAKSFLYFLIIALVTSVFAFTSFFVAEILQQQTGRYGKLLIFMAVSFAVVIALDPLKRFLARITDDIFYKDKINYQDVLRELSIIIAKEIDLDVLLTSLRSALTYDLKLKSVDILVKKNEHFISLTSSTAGKRFQAESNLIEYLIEKQDIIITDEMYRRTSDTEEGDERVHTQQVLDELERQGIEFCAPVYLEGQLKAIIILGQKQSGDIYGDDEVQFFSSLAPQVAVAIEKSQLYESIGEFNLKLQDKINVATKKLKEANLQLQDANAHLKQLDTAKSEFLSIASHQLRTPISALKGYLSMLLEGDFGKVPDKQRQIIADLFESASRLARLINIFLNVSRIESGRFKLDRTVVDVNALVENVLKELQGQFISKKLKVTFTPAKNMRKLFVDSDKVREVILNLIDNAIKYTPSGSIAIATTEEKNDFHFICKDTGIGIRPDDARSLFRKFVRGTGIAQVNTQGSGLGLYIAQRVVSEHGGHIWVESEGLEKGSSFQFILPIITPDPVALNKDANKGAPGAIEVQGIKK